MKTFPAGLSVWFFVLSFQIVFGDPSDHFLQRDSLSNGFLGLNEALEPGGIQFGLSITSIYQQNTRGGISTHRHQGRWSGSYDLEMELDMERLAGLEGGILYMHAEGTWSRRDIDETSIQSLFGVNGDFAPREAFNLIELWYQQSLWDDTLQVRFGKIDMTGGFECRGCPVSFDCNRYANDENTQFLNSALVNNPTIPFPDYGIGAMVLWTPSEFWYVSLGLADAQADKRETGLNTAFHQEDYFVYMAETGLLSAFESANGDLPGAYRLGVWYDPQPKANLNETRFYRDDTGFYLSFDQMLSKENNDPDDSQGLGAFFRYGYANDRSNAVSHFYSGGFQYEGLFEGRDEDVLGIGYAHGVLSDRSSSPFTEDVESVLEVYYAWKAAGWMTLTPSFQYVTNPGGIGESKDAIVAGLRCVLTF